MDDKLVRVKKVREGKPGFFWKDGDRVLIFSDETVVTEAEARSMVEDGGFEIVGALPPPPIPSAPSGGEE